MSLEAIISKIGSDAAEKARAIVRAAEEEKQRALEEQAGLLREEFEKESDKIRTRIEESRKRRELHVRREAERRILNARRTIIDGAIDKAVDRLASAKDGEYLELISALLDSCDLEGEVEVIISPADAGRVTEGFLKDRSGGGRSFVLSKDTHGANGGVILRSGSITQNGTFAMMAELAHEGLVMELSGLLPLREDAEA